MENAKKIWDGLSKQKKMFAIAVAVILVIAIIRSVI